MRRCRARAAPQGRPGRKPGTRPTPRGRAHACAASRGGAAATVPPAPPAGAARGPSPPGSARAASRRPASAPAGAAAGRRDRARTRAPRSSAFQACSNSRSRRSNDSSIADRSPQPHSLRNRARTARSSAGGTAGTGPSWSTSCHESTAPPSVVCRSVLPALSPFVTWSSAAATGSRPPRARNAAPQVQWSSESQAHPTTRSSSSRTRRRLAIRSSISSSFSATRVRTASCARPTPGSARAPRSPRA